MFSYTFYVANCSAPIITNAGVIVEPYNNTVEGAVIYLNCVDGFAPSERRMAVCQSNGRWSLEISSKYMTLYTHVKCRFLQDLHC